MDLTHRFTVPTSVDETWAHFQDIASVAECFPGATVSSVEDDTFAGSVKVKLGPIALVYNGSGTFVEKDEAAHRFVVDAKGKDKRGNGTAGAKVTLTMADSGGSTDVEVVTDLSITGKPAQFGRGVVQDVSDKLLGQFVACLETRLCGGAPVPADVASAPEAVPGPETSAAAPAAVSEPQPPPGPPEPPPPPLPPPTAPTAAGAGVGTRHAAEEDALDLGAAMLPVLARAYWKQALAALGVIAVIWWFVSRD
jgi:uncharacterized protein